MTARGDQLEDRAPWGAWWDWPELAMIGTTDREPDGYDLAVTLVQAPNGGLRVRVTLRRDGKPVRHLASTGRSPWFFAPNGRAIEDIRRCAAEQAAEPGGSS